MNKNKINIKILPIEWVIEWLIMNFKNVLMIIRVTP